MQDVVIFGGKGTAINIAEQIEHARRVFGNPMRVKGFAVDDPSLGATVAGFPIVAGVRDAWERFRETSVQFIFALYRPDRMPERMQLRHDLGIPRERFANFVHPLSYVSASVALGCGNTVLSHSSVHHGAALGDCNIINSNVVVEHDAELQNSVFLAAGACIGARARLGNGVFVGLNATIREDIRVVDFAFIGMSACVLHDIDRQSVVFGVPARPRP